MESYTEKGVILTGDRPTGPLHLGHYAGSLRNRVALQGKHRQYILVADSQALTDNADNPGRIRDNVIEVVLDYLAVGIDPAMSTICLQSALPALAELTLLLMNFVTVSRLERNPTVKSEILMRGFDRDIPSGFLCYPVSQAADITAFGASLVPVGEDQAPMIEQTNELVRRLNRQVGRDILREVEALIPKAGRLPGIDGQAKMSKSLDNTLLLSASTSEISEAVRKMYTDPNHLRASDPGKVEGNVVFAFLDAFCVDEHVVDSLKSRYRAGGLGDTAVKKVLEEVLQDLIAPIRAKRAKLRGDRGYALEVLRRGTEQAEQVTLSTLRELKAGLGLFVF